MKKDSLFAMYNNCVSDIANAPEVYMLDNFTQHMNTSRLKHSADVSYYSFLVCRALRLDYRAGARAGLLHDLFYYDWRAENHRRGYHAKAHPKAALDNARKLSELSSVEEDAIVNHMWPITMHFPRYRESYVVSFVDKYCACREVICACRDKVKRKVKRGLKKSKQIVR